MRGASDAVKRGRCTVTSDIRASSSAWATYSNDDARQVVEALKSEPGPMLIALQALQQRYGYVDPDAVPLVAGILNVSRAEVYGVLTFYHDLRTVPAPRAVVRLCVAEACQAVGSRELRAHAEAVLGGPLGTTTADGIAIESVYCLGNCALGPAALVNGRLVGRVDAAALDRVLDSLRVEDQVL